MKNYRSVEVKILGKDYKYKVDEPEEIINEVLQDIKTEVESYAKKIGGEEVDYILLLILLNEKLNNIKTKNEISNIIEKFGDTLNSILKSSDAEKKEEKNNNIKWG